MQGLILTAGCGRRMQPLSNGTHKALMPIGGTTILSRLVESLRGLGIGTITVVTGHRAEDIRAHVAASFPDVGFRFVHNARFAETNNIVSLALAMASLEGDDDVVLSECDLLLDPSALSPLVSAEPGNIALVDEYRPGMDGTVVTAVDGYVTEVIPPARQGAGFDFNGKLKTLNVYRFEAGFCRRTLQPLLNWYAETVDAGSYYELVLGMLVSVHGQRIKASIVPAGSWAEVDDPNDMAAARFSFDPSARAEILDRALGGHWALDFTDFSFMRNEHFPTDAMVAAMRHAMPDLIAGYGSSQVVLDEKLAWFVGCEPSRLLALNGASQAFPILRRLFVGKRLAIPAPTFGEYTRMFPEASNYQDALISGRSPDDMDMLQEAAASHEVLVVVSPNNPSGTTIPTRHLHSLARSHPDTLVLVDESFLGFSEESSLVAALEADPLDNVLILVSLSKTLGVPGLRVGYAYSTNPELVSAMRFELPVWNLGAPAEFFVELLLKFRPELADSLRRTIEDRQALRTALAGLEGVEAVHAGGGNFVLVRLADQAVGASALRHALLVDHAIEVKDVSSKFPDGKGWIRVAARPPDVSGGLVRAIELVLSGR